jgi:outer membrane protein assembly factor BamB
MRSVAPSSLLARACVCAFGAGCAPFAHAGLPAEPAIAVASPARAPTLTSADLPELPAAPSPTPCGADGWTTYAHDAARTSASGACLRPPLARAWRFAPPHAQGGREATALHAVVAGDAVYVQGTLGDSPALWRTDAHTGELRWAYDSRADIPHLTWPTLAPRTVLMVDDGLFLVDPETGRNRGRALDAWGESLTDGAKLFVMNTWQADGDPPYVGAFDLEGRPLWKRDRMHQARGYRPPDVGGVAMGDGVLVHASNQAQRGAHVAAFDAATSERRWSIETTPESAPSVADGRVLGVERWPAAKVDRLVARSLATGDVVWSRQLGRARGQAPVVAGALAIVHADDGVMAFDRATGEPAWSAPIARTTPGTHAVTTLAAALGSGTLVACAGGRVHVLRLNDGSEAWSGEPAPGTKVVDSPAIADGALYVEADGALVRMTADAE